MWTIIISSIIGLIIGFIGAKKVNSGSGPYFIFGIMGIFFGAVVGLFIGLALPVKYTEKTQTVNIISLEDGNGIQGHFFLGSGYIDNKMQYIFYYETEKDIYKMCQIEYQYVEIKYTTENPNLTVKAMLEDDAIINFFAIDFDDPSPPVFLFQIPEGTIKSDYTLDAK